MSVNIFGNRDLFLSKTAVLRLKTDIKEKKTINPAKYLKEGFIFKIENNNNDTNVYIIESANLSPSERLDNMPNLKQSSKFGESVIIETVDESANTPVVNELDVNKRKLELHKKLKQQLLDSRNGRIGSEKKDLSSMKKTVPPKILEYYTNLISKYKLANLPRPDDVIKNVDKYKLQISAVMGKIGKVSDDPRVSKSVVDYFTALGKHLNIEPMSIDLSNNANMENIANMARSSNIPQMANLSLDKDDDTDDEDAPDLIRV
jgi:hypothetical protein